jgi:hypothetical protein
MSMADNHFKVEHDVETGTITKVALTETELGDLAVEAQKAQLSLDAEAARAVKKAAVLAKLGLTADEAAALLG